MNPLCKWSGGKRAEISTFEKYIPYSYDTYIEPFVGGGALYFYLRPNKAIIADVHKELINFYQQIALGKHKEIYALMQQYSNDEKSYYQIRDKFIPANELEEAFRFFYLRKTCYRGMLRYNSSGKFNIPFGRYKKLNFEELLDEKYYDLLSKASILNSDFNSVLTTNDNDTNFVFLDPPYDSEFTDYGYCQFGRDKQTELADIFKSTKNKCLLVIGETDFIKTLYDGYIVGKYSKQYAFKLHSGRVGKEIDNNHLIIKNY